MRYRKPETLPNKKDSLRSSVKLVLVGVRRRRMNLALWMKFPPVELHQRRLKACRSPGESLEESQQIRGIALGLRKATRTKLKLAPLPDTASARMETFGLMLRTIPLARL